MDNVLKKTYVLIICGGGGKRLWPKSRVNAPKQFIKLFGKKTLFQETVERVDGMVPPERIFIQTVSGYEDEIRAQAPKIPSKNIIVEPVSRNTAMAMVYGAMVIKQKNPEAVIVNLWSDHKIKQAGVFRKALTQAVHVASKGNWLVTIGIKPTFPHTGLGYIEAGEVIDVEKGNRAYKGKFIEKPSLTKATGFVKKWNYFWNTGYYVWRIDSFVNTVKKVNPKLFDCLAAIETALVKGDQKRVREVFEKAEDISIDYAVSEKTDNVVVVPAVLDWNDVGDWKAVYDVSSKDNQGNVVLHEGEKGEFFGFETKNSLIHFRDQLIVTIGVEDLVIIDTQDVILVARQDKNQEVKEVVKILREKGKLKYL